MLGALVPTGGGDPIPLLRPTLIVGRRSECDIVLEYSNVSGRHCELKFSGGYWRLQDLNSSNGVKVNGVRIFEQQIIQPGDVIGFGKGGNHQYQIQYTVDKDAVGEEEEVDPMSISLLERAGIFMSSHSKTPARKAKLEAPKKDFDEMDDDEQALHWMADAAKEPRKEE